LILVLTSAVWALASVLQNRWQIQLDAPVIVAYQHLLAGIGFFALAMFTGQTWSGAEPVAWLALAYLVIFGSIIAFTSFISALKLLPIKIAMTYAFVNPVLAQILGWWILGEELTVWTLIGTTMVILGVFRVFSDKKKVNVKQIPELTAQDNK
jgi:drug/metabolite transporter (DMT)-like permease